MSEAAIRAAIYSAVGGVSSVGEVYDFEQWAAEWPDFLNLFKTTIGGVDQILGWDVSYRGFSPSRDPQFARFVIHTHTFWVQGYNRVNNALATEKIFAPLAIAVCAAIDANSTLHNGVYKHTGPAELQTVEPRTFGSVLCHYARIVVTVPEQVS